MGRRLDTFIQQYVSAKHKAWVTHDVDYKDLAEHGSAMAMTSLLKKVIVASIFSPDMKQHFEEKIREMPEVPQQIVVKTLQAGESQGSDIPKETLSDTDLSIDNEMMTEQKMAKVIFAKSRIEENYNRLKDDFDALKGEYDQLKEDRDRIADRNEDLQDRVISFRSGKDELADARLNAIKVESQLATITSLEEALQKSEDQLANFRDDNDNLRRGTEQAQQLQDELDEYKARQPDLVRKASAFEKYKEKVAQMQRVEAENREYRIKIAEIQEELKRSDTSTASSAGLRRELSEKQRLIEQLERDFHDNQKQVKELIMINRRSETRNAELEAEQLRNRNEIESLERKVEQREDSLISSSRAERLELDSFQAEGSPRSPRQNFSTVGQVLSLVTNCQTDYSQLSEEQLRQKSAELESRNAELELAFVTEEEMRLLLNDMVQRSQQTSEKTTEGQIMIQQQFKSTIASGRHALKKTQQVLDFIMSIVLRNRGDSSQSKATTPRPASSFLSFTSSRKKPVSPKEPSQPSPGKAGSGWTLKSFLK